MGLTAIARAITVARMRTPLHTLFAVALGLGSVAVGGASSGAEARPSVVDAVQAFADGSEEDGVRALRAAAGLGARSKTTATPRAAVTTAVDLVFHFEATAELQGFQLEVSYPLTKGGIAGSADGTQCSSNGDGFFIVNDHDDGTMALIQASAVALTFPIEIRCRFDQNAGETLESADVGV